jgi:putative lipoic acid-binding regulatory protein
VEHVPDNRPSVELLESTHAFPGRYTIKAIGSAADDFEQRVVAAASARLAAPSDLDYSVRATKGGRHIAVTLEVTVQTAEQVRSIYGEIHNVRGLKLLF